MEKRDPRMDPRENDVLHQKDGHGELLVDMVRDSWVYYRVTNGKSGLIAAGKMELGNWRREAMKGCEGI